MRKIIQKGKNIVLNPKAEYILTCKTCDTIFTFEMRDAFIDPDDMLGLDYIYCPNCHCRCTIWRWKRHNEKFLKK